MGERTDFEARLLVQEALIFALIKALMQKSVFTKLEAKSLYDTLLLQIEQQQGNLPDQDQKIFVAMRTILEKYLPPEADHEKSGG